MAATDTSRQAGTTGVARKPGESFALLMAAALALPGITALAADANLRSDTPTLSYNHGNYQESGMRMDVRIDQLAASFPIGGRMELRVNTIRDVSSGASPFANRMVNGKPVMLLASAASIRDTRNAVDVGAGYYGDDQYVGATVGQSIENDYKSRFASADYRRYFNDRNTVVSLGTGFSNDTVWDKYYPLQRGSRPSVEHGRRRIDLVAGVTQIIDPKTVSTVTLSHGHAYGYLNDQYRRAQVVIDSAPSFIADTRPDVHTQVVATGRISRYIEPIRSALHLDYRFAHDSWGADSHTLEAKLRIERGSGWSVAPGLRYTTQKNADFYQLSYAGMPDNGLVSSDYRLAAFGAISPKLEVVKTFASGITVRASVERYFRRYGYRVGRGRGDAVDDFQARLLSLSIDGAF